MIRLVARRWVIIIALSSLWVACVGDSAPSSLPAEVKPYRSVADVQETMLWILEPATDVIWDSAGAVITAEGEKDLSPTTDAGWENVRSHAAVVAESGNLLMLPGRSRGPAWDAYAQALIIAGEVAMAAADAKDADALFDAGGQLYGVCRACHTQFHITPKQPWEEARP